MTEMRTLLLCRDPQSPKWELRRVAPGKTILIGWSASPPECEAGIPNWAASLITSALTANYQLTFPSTVVTAEEVEVSKQFAVTGIWRKLRTTSPLHYSIVTTRRPAAVFKAFEDPGFPWWLRSQLILVSEDRVSPSLNGEEIMALVDAETLDASFLQSRGVLAVVTSGVDGDVASLTTFSGAVEDAVLANLERFASSVAGVRFVVQDEDGFAESLG